MGWMGYLVLWLGLGVSSGVSGVLLKTLAEYEPQMRQDPKGRFLFDAMVCRARDWYQEQSRRVQLLAGGVSLDLIAFVPHEKDHLTWVARSRTLLETTRDSPHSQEELNDQAGKIAQQLCGLGLSAFSYHGCQVGGLLEAKKIKYGSRGAMLQGLYQGSNTSAVQTSRQLPGKGPSTPCNLKERVHYYQTLLSGLNPDVHPRSFSREVVQHQRKMGLGGQIKLAEKALEFVFCKTGSGWNVEDWTDYLKRIDADHPFESLSRLLTQDLRDYLQMHVKKWKARQEKKETETAA